MVKNLFKGCLTVPNLLSLIRIFLIPAFAVLYYKGHIGWAVLMLALSGISDFLDGKIARRFNQVSELGKTAIAEGLALRIANGEVPAKLAKKEIHLLSIICFMGPIFISMAHFMQSPSCLVSLPSTLVMKNIAGRLPHLEHIIFFI
jgi:hypothetical protein